MIPLFSGMREELYKLRKSHDFPRLDDLTSRLDRNLRYFVSGMMILTWLSRSCLFRKAWNHQRGWFCCQQMGLLWRPKDGKARSAYSEWMSQWGDDFSWCFFLDHYIGYIGSNLHPRKQRREDLKLFDVLHWPLLFWHVWILYEYLYCTLVYCSFVFNKTTKQLGLWTKQAVFISWHALLYRTLF